MLTQDASTDIGAVWPDLSPRLHRYLRRQGCSADLADDLVQDVAVRAIRTAVRFADTEDLLRWCYVVGRNLYVDHVRAMGRRPQEQLAADFDRPVDHDIESIVEHRMSLTDVIRGAGLLSRDDRVALFEPLLDDAVLPMSRTEATRLAVRRHRARVRLRAVLKTAVVLLGGCWAQVRSWLRPGPAVAVAVTGASFVAMAVLPAAPAHPEAAGPAATTRAVVHVAAHQAVRPAAPRTRAAHAPVSVTSVSRKPAGHDTEVAIADTGFGARSGTAAPRGRELACAGLVAGRDDLCLLKPGSGVAPVR